MKRRVLQLIGSFHQGGSERQAIALARALKDEGSFDVSIATLNDDGILRAEVDGIGLREIPEFPLTSFYNANFFHQTRRFAAYLRDERIDVIQSHDFYTNVFGMTAATLAGTPVRIASKRETTEMRSNLQELVERLAFGRAHRILANSAAVCDHLVKSGVATERVTVIYNGVDVERFADSRISRIAICRKLGLPVTRGAQFVTLVANLRHDVKNVPMLLRSASRVVRDLPDTHFVIAGEGDLQGELRGLAETLGVSSVHFIGRCDHIPDLLAVSHACVLTSSAEGFPNAILEYMAAAKPVVATNVGGNAEAVIEGETGYLVKSDDDATLAERLAALLSNTRLAKKMGAAGRELVEEKFDSSRQLSEIVGLYTNCLAAQKTYGHAAEFSKMDMPTNTRLSHPNLAGFNK